jgi:hypothetical protein
MTNAIIRRAVLGLAGLAAMAVLATGSAMAANSGDGQNRNVRIINETEHTMIHFYASNASARDWQEDILGRDVLKPGEDVMINIDDGTGHCKYDFRAVFDNGRSLEKYGVDVCKITSFRYGED